MIVPLAHFCFWHGQLSNRSIISKMLPRPQSGAASQNRKKFQLQHRILLVICKCFAWVVTAEKQCWVWGETLAAHNSALYTAKLQSLCCTMTTWWLDSNSKVTVVNCRQHGDWAANGSVVTVLPAINNIDFTDQSPSIYTSGFQSPTSYVGLLLRSAVVATASCRAPFWVSWGYSETTVTEATAYPVAAEYPHSTLNGTSVFDLEVYSHSGTALWEPQSQSRGIWMCSHSAM